MTEVESKSEGVGWSPAYNSVPSDDVERYAPETQHTPGPWEVDHGAVFQVGGGWPIATVQHGAYPEVHEANAQLIAQAPTLKAENEALKALNADLVEALTGLRDFANRYGYGKGIETRFEDWVGYLTAADEVITKAKGDQN